MPDRHTTGLFVFSRQREDSAVLGKNFVSLWNPAASTHLVTIGSFFTSYMTTVPSPLYPMRGYRTFVQPTGGTLANNATEVVKFDTQRFDALVEIRYDDPTCVLDGAIFNAAPGVGQGVNKDQSSDIQQVDSPAGFNPFTLRPGEGVVLRQDQGAVGHLWNLSIVWREMAS